MSKDTMVGALRTDALMARIYAGDAADKAQAAHEVGDDDSYDFHMDCASHWHEKAHQMEQRLAYWTRPVDHSRRDRFFRGIVEAEPVTLPCYGIADLAAAFRAKGL